MISDNKMQTVQGKRGKGFSYIFVLLVSTRYLLIYLVLTCTCDGSTLTGTCASSGALCFLFCLLVTSRDLALVEPDNSCKFYE